MTEEIKKELIWTHNGVDYIAKAITENEWKRLGGIVRMRLLTDCKDIDDPAYRRERANEIQATDYPPMEVLKHTQREDIRNEFTYAIFKDNKGMTKDIAASFWADDEFGKAGGFLDDVLEASGMPIKQMRGLIEEKPDINPTQAET